MRKEKLKDIWSSAKELDIEYVLGLLPGKNGRLDVMTEFSKRDSLHLGPQADKSIKEVIRKGARLVTDPSVPGVEQGYKILIKSHCFISLNLPVKDPIMKGEREKYGKTGMWWPAAMNINVMRKKYANC